MTGGEDALGEVTVMLRTDGALATGSGVATDIIEASARAYLRALSNALEGAATREAEAATAEAVVERTGPVRRPSKRMPVHFGGRSAHHVARHQREVRHDQPPCPDRLHLDRRRRRRYADRLAAVSRRGSGIAALAERQHGVVARGQLLRLGLDEGRDRSDGCAPAASI